MMKMIRTVLGDIGREALGHTQCHEHIFIERGRSAEVSSALLIDDLQKSTDELALYKSAGGCAVVDAQPVMAGRMADWLIAASRASGVHIVASTGFHKTVFYYDDSYIFSLKEEQIAQLYIDEITKGMEDTGVCAGLIKTAVDTGGIFTDALYEKLHTAAAEAQMETGAPLMCHIEPGADAAEVADFYLGKGVAADRLWLAHLDRARFDPTYHRDILSREVYLEYDTIARPRYHSDRDECRLIAEMLASGYEDQLLLGLDTTRARLKSYGAETGLDYILETFLPLLTEGGATQAQCRKLTVENPGRALLINL